MHVRNWLRVALILAALGASSCSKDSSPTAPAPVDPAPAANSPENALLRLQWAWVNRDPEVAEGLFTDDFVFVFSGTDSAGMAYRDAPWVREDELGCNQHMFAGGASEPPATSITLDFDRVLRKSQDTRPGKRNKWHWRIETSVALTVRNVNQSFECNGRATFYFVRGDSAAIPPELVMQGVRPDSTRWWIERWEEEAGRTGQRGAGWRGSPRAPAVGWPVAE